MTEPGNVGRRDFIGGVSFLSGSSLLAARVRSGSSGGISILRVPDLVALHAPQGMTRLARSADRWQWKDVEVRTEVRADELSVSASAQQSGLHHILLRWQSKLSSQAKFLGDHWERSYGDLEWRASVPNRVMPWYFLMSDGRSATGFGVRTGAAALCFWQVDAEGISLWLDVRNGGSAVQLGGRSLLAARVVVTHRVDASAFDTACDLCRSMCPHPRLPSAPVYGGNNWYYTYGHNFTDSDIVHDAELLAGLSQGHRNRPYMVVDMGWERAADGAGPTSQTNERFPDMPALVSRLKKIEVRPGIWMRPLLTVEDVPARWRLAGSEKRLKRGFSVLDPSVPDALGYIQNAVTSLRDWGFELIKHDFSTYDMLGRWGFEMGAGLTDPGWSFADRTRTTAEIITSFYLALRKSAGDALLIGCNTMGHLGAGIFELQRIGDDTSGRDWERTRKMGINALAFRLPQHNNFFVADADCVPLTPNVPWNMTRQWLDLAARSGTSLFISADPKSVGPEQRAALRNAFSRAATPQPIARPIDWQTVTTPKKWSFGADSVTYQWYPEEGASPFTT